MTRSTKYTLISLGILIVCALVLSWLVYLDSTERVFFSSGGIVYFAQYFILSAGMLALFSSILSIWHNWILPVTTKTWVLFFVQVPLAFVSLLLTYAGLLFLTFI